MAARPLKRAMQSEFQDPLAMKILAGDFHSGDEIQADMDSNGSIIFLKKADV